ncbi:MAG: hypothetical protein GC171_10360 [Terrimonas sp.]|nr:hypothetical protein [Terrimonas sp.]
MGLRFKTLITGMGMLLSLSLFSQNWVHTVESYGRDVFMPADKYKWDWGQATFLNAVVHLYNQAPAQEKGKYLAYIKTAMDATYDVANGKHPNAVASGHGMAFLARVTGEKKYRDKAMAIYEDYLKTPRAPNGGISHRVETVELWDDTIYMISMFLLEMYRLTGDEKYIASFVEQVKAHREKLADNKWGLWYHGWDADSEPYDDKCSMLGWPDPVSHHSSQFWGRGNGWVTMALADALHTIPKNSKYRKTLTKEFKNILMKLPELQDPKTGHWFQLPIYPGDPANFLESSCTAMFGYAITLGLDMKLLREDKYRPVADLAYKGLEQYSLVKKTDNYFIPGQVCGGTCIGDKNYYFQRKITEGTPFGIGAFVLFGLAYQQYNNHK